MAAANKKNKKTGAKAGSTLYTNHYQIPYILVMFWSFHLMIGTSKKLQNGSYVPLHIGNFAFFFLHLSNFNMDN
jgi:hypothetical protein